MSALPAARHAPRPARRRALHVVLVAPPWGEVYGAFRPAARAGVAYPPLGLCYLMAHLRRAGHHVRLIDAEAEGLGRAALLDEIARLDPDLVGVQVVSPLWDVAVELCRALRARVRATLVLGGPHVTVTGAESLERNPWADLAVPGEGELALVAVAEALRAGEPPRAIPGTLWREGDQVRSTPAEPMPRDLDRLGFPDRSDLRHARYLFSVPGRGRRRFTTLTATRGCPFECTFCSEPAIFGRRTRFRTPEHVVEEIASARRETGAEHFIFVDDTLTVERKRTLAICELLRRHCPGVTLEGWTHANTVDRPLLEEMHGAGFVRLSFGVESGDPDVLRSLRKGTDHARIRAAVRAAKAAGIETRASVILGLPGDTRASVEATIAFVRDLAELDHCYFNIAMPYPGTAMREAALRGEGGVRLLTREYSHLRRQGQRVVMEVGDLDARALLALQRRAYRSFWLRPRRVRYNLLRAGPRAGLANAWAFLQSFVLPAPRRVRFASEVTALSDRLGA